MIKYIGSKRLLLPRILEVVGRMRGVRTVLDAFSGTSRVGHALKAAGYQVTANDHNLYAATLARCYVAADRRRVLREVERALRDLASLPPRAGWFTETYCVQSRFFQPHNGARVDAIRDAIAQRGYAPEVEAVLLVALMESADRVDSTCGVQMAYLRNWADRSFHELSLRLPGVLDGEGNATQLDAAVAVASGAWDLVYLDPPYNQHRYLGNYHIWESLVRWDRPEVYGVACKRIDCREYKSPYNSKRAIHAAFADLVSRVRCRHLLVSFSDEGFVKREEMVGMLRELGRVRTIAVDFKRYVGAQIGIFNPEGEKVGTPGRLRNVEYLFLVSPRRAGNKGREQVALFGD